jgi:hypothetical protein
MEKGDLRYEKTGKNPGSNDFADADFVRLFRYGK